MLDLDLISEKIWVREKINLKNKILIKNLKSNEKNINKLEKKQ